MIATLDSTAIPAVEKRATIADLTSVVSASRLNTFHTCRLRFAFKYVQNLEAPASGAMYVGKAVHAALERWSNARWKGKFPDSEAMHHVFLERWSTAQDAEPVEWEAGEEDAQREKAWGLVEMYLRETPIAAGEKPEAVEVRVEADLSGQGLPTLIGIIDLVRPGGVILDFKTSSTTPILNQVWHRNETQLAAYAVLYRAGTGQREGGFEIHHLVKTKSPKLVVSRFDPVTPDQEVRFLRIIESYVEGVEREDYVPSPGLHCSYCPYYAQCSVWKGGA